MAELELLSVVALTEGLSAKGLLRGQVGTIVEKLAPGVYEVEFSDDAGGDLRYGANFLGSVNAVASRTQTPRSLAASL